MICFQTSRRFEPVHARQPDIHHDEVRRLLAGQRQAIGPVRRLGYDVAVGFENVRHQLHTQRVVLDQEDTPADSAPGTAIRAQAGHRALTSAKRYPNPRSVRIHRGRSELASIFLRRRQM